ncbi:helix-turn-helix transcriptional regulator [Rathayibacter toxicus]|uniref:LuxR family transcriptional regulator n=1 Tax=Rathayibacter toxicus TaxID=145458 RepID=A0A2S5Y9R5_9MICO|nr:helix-turn-helix transcriptional regulator [Rathayibacter toxicus]PPG24065.1 LuxR family transcriptional regulator [Rathayibacter toxicus]PPG48102.1 LuxR family transcriptional regulator [Rathayibacter toxicus]PPH25315.1 LuxR family transcriptional regulator [Rathayibacter toxicus]PPH58561.1 LuxR family transcriptional regulator [Rathayibacter toxicus]PPH61189.1 LuxR family transcriptional regulator [Rathayibacter toxicus]
MPPGLKSLPGEFASSAVVPPPRAEVVTIVHSSRLEGECLALCLRAGSRVCSEPRVRAGWGRYVWQSARGSVVVLDEKVESASLIPAAVAALVRQGSKVVVLVREVAAPVAEAARYAGASAVVSDRVSVEEVVAAVESCLLGARPRTVSLGDAGSMPSKPRSQQLTARELAVLELFLSADEPATATVAERLGISVNTVKVHVANVRRRLGDVDSRNRVALRGALEERGWLELR